jgi:hypothetical protein
MDKHNRFHTPTIYSLVRIDWAILMTVGLVLVYLHRGEVGAHWGRFLFAFALPDLIGTFPGLYYYYGRRTGPRRSIPTFIHQLYNFGHCFAGIALFCAVWYLITGHLEWAMLAFPIHLAGDRSVFGNTYKPFGTAFEPVPHEAFRRFVTEYEAAGTW